MDTICDYLTCAAELFELAKRTTKPTDKDRLLRLAGNWLALANRARPKLLTQTASGPVSSSLNGESARPTTDASVFRLSDCFVPCLEPASDIPFGRSQTADRAVARIDPAARSLEPAHRSSRIGSCRVVFAPRLGLGLRLWPGPFFCACARPSLISQRNARSALQPEQYRLCAGAAGFLAVRRHRFRKGCGALRRDKHRSRPAGRGQRHYPYSVVDDVGRSAQRSAHIASMSYLAVRRRQADAVRADRRPLTCFEPPPCNTSREARRPECRSLCFARCRPP